MINEKINFKPPKNYLEHREKAVETKEKFKHVIALTLNPKANYKEGVIRCITSRKGDIEKKGYIAKSLLYKIKGDSLDKFIITKKLDIKNEKKL